MSEVYSWTVAKLMEESASGAPTPGGGSVSALVGSLGTSMVAMVGNLTVGKEKYKDVEPQAKEILDEANGLMKKLEDLVSQDIAVFNQFMDVLKLPKDTDEEKAIRATKMQEAVKAATVVPMDIAKACFQGVVLAEKLSTIGNKGAISDVGVAAYIAEAAMNAAFLSVDINVPMIKDEEFVNKVVAEKNQMVTDVKVIKDKAIAQVQARL